MSPDVGLRDTAPPPETQFFLAEAGRNSYVLLLPLVGTFFRTALWGAGGEGKLNMRIESGDPSVKSRFIATSLYVGVGSDPFKLLERGFAAVADRTGTFRVRTDKTLPSHLDDFGWCTWDAFYSKVDPAGIKSGLEGLIKGGTPAKFLILDDGWQSTDNDEQYRCISVCLSICLCRCRRRWPFVCVVFGAGSLILRDFCFLYPERRLRTRICVGVGGVFMCVIFKFV